jgi:Bacterial membrane protein YfhO
VRVISIRAAIVMVVLPLVVGWFASDGDAEGLVLRRAVQQSIAEGQWPLWNPLLHCGQPMAVTPEAAPYSPLTLLAIALPAKASLWLTAALSLFLAAFGVYLFVPSLIATVVVVAVLPLNMTAAFLPLLLYATRRVVREPGIASGTWLMAVLSLSLLSGSPESQSLNYAVAGAYALFELIRRFDRRAVVTTCAAAIVALLVSAIHLLPIFELEKQSFAQCESGQIFIPRRVRLSEEKQIGTRALTSIHQPGAATETFENGQGALFINSQRTGEVYFDANMKAEGWVVVTEPAWPGWRAEIDRQPVKIRVANRDFIGVNVPPGPHIVHLVYRPESFVRGRAISLATVAALTFFAVARRIMTRTRT